MKKTEEYRHLSDKMGYWFTKLPQDILDELKPVIDKVQDNFNQAIPANYQLAGQIDKEYSVVLPNNIIEYIKMSSSQFMENNPNYVGNNIISLFKKDVKFVYEGDAWVNFQEKYEYNPLHAHTGVFSFVIWYQIPFYKADEIKYGAGKGKEPEHNKNGEFEFAFYNGSTIITHPLGIDKTMEGHMAVFPSNLNHIVYPFYTSDDYRITLSGNIYLQGH